MKHSQRTILNLLTLVTVLFLLSCQPQAETKVIEEKEEFRLQEYSIVQLQEEYASGTISIEDVVKSYLERIESVDKGGLSLHSIIKVNPDALEIARRLDAELKDEKNRGPMHGIPIVLKDNIDTHDKMPTTAGSRALMNSYPLQDSFLAKKLREAGAVIIAKANLSEWANFRGELSSSGWSGVGGQVKNPYNIARNPCGSGSGVAVSANLTMLAIGTETNGSIVCPSTTNGIVGIKPTVGLVSRSGIIPISFTQDTAGPMARSVTDAAICLAALVGIDSLDSKTIASGGKFHSDYTKFLNSEGLEGKKIGLYTAPRGQQFKVDKLMEEAVEFIKSQGAEVVEIDWITGNEVGGQSFQIMLFEYKDGLNKYFASLGPTAAIKNLEELIEFNKSDSVEMEFYNQKYLEMAMEKEGLDSDEYKSTLAKMLTGSRADGIDKVMDEYGLDAIMAPSGGPAWLTDHTNGDSFQVGSSSPAASAGYPNITVPMGFVDGLPVGISFFGRAWSEPVLLEIAYSYEQGTKHRKAPF